MKRFNIISAIFLTVIFLVVFTVNVGAQDKKEAKKEEIKVQKTETPAHKPNSPACVAKHATGACEGHKAGECQPEKCEKCNCTHQEGEKHVCNCDPKTCSKECLEKHAAGECKDLKAGETQKSNEVKKQPEKKDKK